MQSKQLAALDLLQ